MDPTSTSLGDLIRTARTNKGLTSYQVAERTGIVHRATIGRIETGDITRPRPETLQRLAAVLDLDLDNLLATAGYLRAEDLPDLGPYLRAKHTHLPDDAIARILDHFDYIATRYQHPNDEPAEHGDGRSA